MLALVGSAFMAGLGKTRCGGGSTNRPPTTIIGISTGAWMSDGMPVITAKEKAISGPSDLLKISNNGSTVFWMPAIEPFWLIYQYAEAMDICGTAIRTYGYSRQQKRVCNLAGKPTSFSIRFRCDIYRGEFAAKPLY